MLTFRLAPTFNVIVPDAFKVEFSADGKREKLLTVIGAPGPVNVADDGNVIVTGALGLPVIENSAAAPGLL